MLVPITSIIRGCPNKAGRSNFDNNKIAISLTVKISEALHYSRFHSNSLGLSNFDCSLTNCEIRQSVWDLTVSGTGLKYASSASCHKVFGPFYHQMFSGPILSSFGEGNLAKSSQAGTITHRQVSYSSRSTCAGYLGYPFQIWRINSQVENLVPASLV